LHRRRRFSESDAGCIPAAPASDCVAPVNHLRLNLL
jgi:hypothetical protein